jgi:hypothetical protein
MPVRYGSGPRKQLLCDNRAQVFKGSKQQMKPLKLGIGFWITESTDEQGRIE